MPSKQSYVNSFHKLVCIQIVKAVDELKEQGKEVYPPLVITYILDGDEFSLLFEELNDG